MLIAGEAATGARAPGAEVALDPKLRGGEPGTDEETVDDTDDASPSSENSDPSSYSPPWLPSAAAATASFTSGRLEKK